MGGSWGPGRKNVRAIRFFVKPPPPWGSLVMNPRNIATVEKIIPETNILTELAAPGDVDPLTAPDAVFAFVLRSFWLWIVVVAGGTSVTVCAVVAVGAVDTMCAVLCYC